MKSVDQGDPLSDEYFFAIINSVPPSLAETMYRGRVRRDNVAGIKALKGFKELFDLPRDAEIGIKGVQDFNATDGVSLVEISLPDGSRMEVDAFLVSELFSTKKAILCLVDPLNEASPINPA